MDEHHGSDEEGKRALDELCRLVSRQLLQDSSFVDGGFHIEFHGGTEDLEQKLSTAIGQSIVEISKDKLMSLLMWKTRAALREQGHTTLIDNERPPGFSSN